MRLLDAVLRRGEALEAALPGAARGLPANDRGLAHAIAAEALRRLPDLDALIDSATKQRLPDDAKARTALRIALVQVMRLGTPPHAAIATVLPLVDGGPRKLVHGVFGTLARRGVTLPEVPTLPPEVVARWGAEVAEGAAHAIAAPPPLDLTLADPRETISWAEQLGGVSLAPGHVRIAGNASVPSLPGFAEGAWWVQDLAASIAARLLAGVGETVVDVCAAPGGKCLQLAALGKRVTALDVSATRLERLKQNLERTHLVAEVVTGDALYWQPGVQVDAVLLDAPCSATGIFRRHPDVLHRAHPRLIAEAADLQRALLGRVASWVKPGGTLVFATCSLERAEGEVQAEAFLASQPGFVLEPATTEELPVGIVPHERGWVRTWPGTLAEQGGCDGFFVARFRRAG